jgi:hypothetical protein
VGSIPTGTEFIILCTSRRGDFGFFFNGTVEVVGKVWRCASDSRSGPTKYVNGGSPAAVAGIVVFEENFIKRTLDSWSRNAKLDISTRRHIVFAVSHGSRQRGNCIKQSGRMEKVVEESWETKRMRRCLRVISRRFDAGGVRVSHSGVFMVNANSRSP